MAEGYESYHVPQQSRRDKLRVVAQTQTQSHHPTSCLDNFQECDHGLLVPFCAPSLISTSNFLTCTTTNCSSNINTPSSGAGKEVNLMGYLLGGMINNTSSSSSNSHHLYMDLQSSVQFNPVAVPSINSSNPSLFTPQNLRASLDHSLAGAEVVGYKPDSLPTVHDVVNSGTGQGLSLSLSSHHTQQNHSSRPLELNLQRYESSMFSGKVSVGYALPAVDGSGLTSNDLARSSVLLGPWTGYASILKGSRFLKPAQQLLEELCEVGRGVYADRNTADSDMMNPPPQESLGASEIIDDTQSCSSEGKDQRRKKSRLISLLNEVYRMYKQYYEEMQAVMASFESVAGLGNAAPFASLALKAMSKHFRCLKNAITDQLHFTIKAHGHAKYGKDQNQVFVNPDEGFYSQRPVHNSALIEHQPVWRPQRGLPERAVTVLRTWLFDHFLRPYPTDTDKLMLAKQTGLSRNQVSNWFINARVRLWKPMVEEIHKLETRQAQKAFQREGQHANRPNDNSLASEHPSTSTQGIQEFPSKRTRSDFPTIPIGSEDQLTLSYENLSRQSHFDVNLNAAGGIGHVSLNTAGGSSGVSLTLGLHQNNGIGLSEAFPMSTAGRFSIDGNGEGYIVGGFEAQNGQFGREVIGGQLLHDFVG